MSVVDNNLIQEDNSQIDNSSKQQKQKDNKKVLLQLRKTSNHQQDIKKSDEDKSDDDSILKNNSQDDTLIKNETNYNKETSTNAKIVNNDKSNNQKKLKIKDDSRIRIEKNKELNYSENKREQLPLLKDESHNKNEDLTGTVRFGQENQQNLSQSSSQVNNPNPSTQTIINIKDLKKKSPEDLVSLAESFGIENAGVLSTQELIFAISKKNIDQGGVMYDEGVLEVLQEGFGFLRSTEANYSSGPGDVYVSPNQIRKLGLKTGDTIYGQVRAPQKGEKYFAMSKVVTANFRDPMQNLHRINFDNLTPLYPTSKFNLESINPINKDLSTRIVDIISPIGKGQRVLIVAPPKVGKTTLLQNIAHSITENHKEVTLIVLLIDERPEEVTDMKRSINAEVVSSTFDEPAQRHVQLAEIVIEKAKRLVENKKDVVILLDSITRLARAYNTVIPSSGKVLTGGVDSNALQKPKRFFGAARNIEQGGSLTIIATAMVDTGSRMDDVIFEEFKSTGNSEIVLDRRTADKRVFPALDVTKSGTRKEELLIDKALLPKYWILRRILNAKPSATDSIEFLIEKMSATKSNSDFFELMNS
jgi:transcription termination factor Rho